MMDGSLQNLNPIVMPDLVGWWPLAPGLQLLLVVIALAMGVLAWRRWLAWRDDRYRREALRELASLSDLALLPSLLKRAALSAYPRERVAPLHGAAWHRFLDESAGFDRFATRCGDLLDQLAYGGGAPSESDAQALREAARAWLKQHERDT
jgi:hypothetical protein